jgi:hypothetical protein
MVEWLVSSKGFGSVKTGFNFSSSLLSSGRKERKLIASEVFPIEDRVGFSRELVLIFSGRFGH